MTRGFFHEYSWGFATDRPESATRDPNRKPLCRHAEEYLTWAAREFPDLVHATTLTELDEGILALTKEFAFRRRFITPERFNTCLEEVYLELLDGLIDRHLALYRHWSPPSAPTPTLFLGDDEEEDQ